MLRPDIVGMRGSMVIRPRLCMRPSTYPLSSTPPPPTPPPLEQKTGTLSPQRRSTATDIIGVRTGAADDFQRQKTCSGLVVHGAQAPRKRRKGGASGAPGSAPSSTGGVRAQQREAGRASDKRGFPPRHADGGARGPLVNMRR